MPTSRGLSAGSSDVARFLDTAHKARYVEIFESQVLKTAKSVRHESAIILAAERAVEKVLTQHISYLALGMLQ